MIFAYAGDALHPEPIELQFPEQLIAPEFSSFLCYCEWGGDYRYVYDNVMDPMHGTFLHKQSHSMSFGESTATFQIRDTPTGFVFEKEGQRNVNFDWTEFLDTGAHWLRLDPSQVRDDREEAAHDIRAMQLVLRMERAFLPKSWRTAKAMRRRLLKRR